ncbi:MAG: nucleoside deaminase [Planctomycetes bacterium]|nr:nucleoside deaminase [Planctomycetota bacterium]
MREAIQLSFEKMLEGAGGPFGAVIARGGEIVARGHNRVTSALDPTAHAEIVAIREACRALGRFHLEDCALYASCEPCPMCLGAIYWARIGSVFYANTREDAAAIGFDDDFIYREIERPLESRRVPMVQILREEAQEAFRAWREKADRIEY